MPSYRVVDLDFEDRMRSISNSASPSTDGLNTRHQCSEYLSKQEVADRLKVNPRTVERAIIAGELPAYKVLSRVRICRDELENWIRAQRVPPSIHDV